MTQQTATRAATFSATTSWVGVVLLGASLTQVALPPSQATSPGPQTASIEYQGFDEYFGVLSGGVQRDFTSGQYGWQGPAFDALGMMGMGVGTGVFAGGGILAALRRRFARTRSTAVDSSGRID